MENVITERFYTVAEMSKLTGVKPWALRRAINDKIIPAYTFNGSSRWLLKISDVNAAVTNLRAGGWDE